jgi:hypothetical protein
VNLGINPKIGYDNTHRLKRVTFLSSHNQQTMKTRTSKKGKIKYKIYESKQISSRSYTITPKKFAETERKYQIAETKGKTKYQIVET